jgi:hypothetical protein
MNQPGTRGWWERWPALLAFALLTAVPLLWPAIPPLTDLPGHMGRYHVSMAIGGSPALQRYYSFAWAPVGNLGVDVAVLPLAALFGVELGTKLIVIAIPMLAVAGMLWTAREAHGRVPPTALFALPLAYAWPFQFGFVNFELAQALALLVFALWLRLGRTGRLPLRAALFVPISCLLWLAHNFGWGLFGLMAFGAELARLRHLGWRRAIGGAIMQCLSLALPALFMLVHHPVSERGASTGDWFDLPTKVHWLVSILRDRLLWFDGLCLVPLVLLLYGAARDRRLGYTVALAWPAALCLLAFLLLPRLLMGGAYVDMRMAPVMLMLALLAIRPPAGSNRLARGLAIAAFLFFAVRTTATTISFAQRSVAQQRELAAIDHIPHGAAVLALIALPCEAPDTGDRLAHLAAMAIVRRDAFVNDQWTLEGQQLLGVRHIAAAPYLADPSQIVYPPNCHGPGSNFVTAIAHFNRRAFDYVWTIGFPPGAARAPDLLPVWTNGRSALYRVSKPARH